MVPAVRWTRCGGQCRGLRPPSMGWRTMHAAQSRHGDTDGKGGAMEQLETREGLLDTVRGLRQELDRVVAEAGEQRSVQPGSFGAWSFKDVIAHLTGWRLVTAARLEAGLNG